MQNVNVVTLQNAMRRKGYEVFGLGDYNLNLVGIRSADTKANTFNDALALFFYSGKNEHLFLFPITTDPGMYWRQNPAAVNGTAILVPGQYRGSWEIGLHKGRPALTQCKAVTVYRDNNRDQVLDMAAKTESGLFGINIHHAIDKGTSQQVDKWSAGCQVFANFEDFDLFLAVARKAASLYGPRFTYTLINEADL